MVIRKALEKVRVSDIDVDALIDKGGEVKSDKKSDGDWTNINLRLPKSMLKQIDECLIDRIGLPRSVWLLEAIQEKLKKVANES